MPWGVEELAHEVSRAAAYPFPHVFAQHAAKEIVRPVRHSHVPSAIRGDSRKGLMGGQDHPHRAHHLDHLRVVERVSAEQRHTRGLDASC